MIFLLCSFYVFSYDYPWAVEYEIKKDSLEEINQIIQNYINIKPEFHVYDLDLDQKSISVNDSNDVYYKLNLEKREWKPFGQVLCGSIFLRDVDAIIGFYVPYVPGLNKYFIRLVSYSENYKVDNERIVIIRGKYKSFNDVEPTKMEGPIKESFEKNFLSKLPLEYEYFEPAALDRNLSKFLSLFRKRKNFVD